MFSAAPIQKLAKQFVCIKVDPEKTGNRHAAFEYKSTHYFPEVVLLSPQGEVLGRLEDQSVKGVTEKLAAVLKKMK